MTVAKDDFNKIWASTSSVPTYTFSDTDYQNGWEFVDNLPPTRAMWDEIQRKNDEKMQLLYNGASFWVDSVADLRTANASIGEVYATKGYYTANDGGNGFYVIRADNSDTDDGGSIIILDNGNVAELITNGTVTPEQFGAKGDGTTNDLTALKNAFSFADTVVFAKKTYIVEPSNYYDGITITKDCVIKGNGATIKRGTAYSESIDVLRGSNCTITIRDIMIDANNYGDETNSVNCIVMYSCTFFGNNIVLKNASHHNIVINGGDAFIDGINMINCGLRNTASFIYLSGKAQTRWANVYLKQETFDPAKQGQGFYIHDGNHEITNYTTESVDVPWDVRNDTTVINNGYFHKSGGIIVQTSDQNESANITATNLVYDEVAALDSNGQTIIHITSVRNLNIKNCLMLVSSTLQDLKPNNFAFIMKIDRGQNAGDKVIQNVHFDNLSIIGDNICTNGIYAVNLDADTNIEFINCKFPTITNNLAYLVSCYFGMYARFVFKGTSIKGLYNGRQTQIYDSTTSGYYYNYIYEPTVLQRGTTAERPILAPVSTALYYDTTINKLIYWNGTSWVELT